MPQTGATRYQKFLKSEKAKTKLKSKKDLPKGTNITKTNFKIKKIVIKEQLKKHGEHEALSVRKLNVKDLVTRLNHFNVHSRTEALNGLKDLITAFPEVLDKSLGQLIHGVTPLVLNIEKSVRRESLKALHLILSNATINKVDPFFDILSTYLRSAMTHIDDRIQEDSLLFLDILFLCTPERVAKDFHKIIPNFLDMISKLRVDSKPGRTLTINLKSQITSVKWRIKVLHRLQDFLNKFVDFSKNGNGQKYDYNNTHIFDKNQINFYPLFNPSYISNCYLPIFSSNTTESAHMDEIEKFQSYFETLMPLLFETWLEVCPNTDSNKNIETVLPEDSAILLKHTLQVISLTWDIVEYLQKSCTSSSIKTIFVKKFRKLFTMHFVNPFPFVTNVKSNRSKNTLNTVFEDVITDPKMMEENLSICYLFVLFNPNVNINNQKKEITAVLGFIEKLFNQNTKDNLNDMVVKVLHAIFSEELTGWTRNHNIMDALFRKIIWSYFNKNLPAALNQNIFNLLCKIALNSKLGHFHASECYEKWVQYLPDILLDKSITVQSIDMIQKFAVQNNKVFNDVIKPKLLRIVENLPKIQVIDSDNNSSSYQKLLSLLYWIKVWDNESLNLMERQLLHNEYNNTHSSFIYDTLKWRSTVNNGQ